LSHLLSQLLKPEHVQKAEERTQEILADPLIVKWRTKYPWVTDAEIKTSMNRVYQYRQEYYNCAKCPGLDKCPNDLEGHYTQLIAEPVNGVTQIYDHKVACKKLLARQSQDAIRSRIRSFYVDEASLEQAYSAKEIVMKDPDRVLAVDTIVQYIADTKKKGLQKRGLYLVGNLGTGKTFLMGYLLHELAKEGYNGAIIYMPDFCEDLKAMFETPQKLKETIDMLKETDLLVFDDIGAENMTPWLRDHVLGTILNYRMNRKPTFFTSNHGLDDLEKHFSFTNRDGDDEFKGARLMDRIRPFVEIVNVKGKNKRGGDSPGE
uniref:primosomal protein DnaI n=1 Tax=Gorillibacterium massiliense TaxID=1280390 RepID=UPI002351EE92